jgi:hypothetical protein
MSKKAKFMTVLKVLSLHSRRYGNLNHASRSGAFKGKIQTRDVCMGDGDYGHRFRYGLLRLESIQEIRRPGEGKE